MVTHARSHRYRHTLLILLLPLVALFASTGLNGPEAPSRAPEAIEASTGNLGALETTERVDLERLLITTTLPPTTTTTAPPVTAPPTTARPRPTPTTAPPVVEAAAEPEPVQSNGDVWERLAQCETGMRNDTGDPYWGYFQFSVPTWQSVGESGLPSDYGYEYQRAAAQRLQARSGWGQWPGCSRQLGLR